MISSQHRMRKSRGIPTVTNGRIQRDHWEKLSEGIRRLSADPALPGFVVATMLTDSVAHRSFEEVEGYRAAARQAGFDLECVVRTQKRGLEHQLVLARSMSGSNRPVESDVAQIEAACEPREERHFYTLVSVV